MASKIFPQLHLFVITMDHPPKGAASKFIGLRPKPGSRITFNAYVPGGDRVEVGLRLKAWIDAECVEVRGVVFRGPVGSNGVAPEDALLAISEADIELAKRTGKVLVGAFKPWNVDA